MKTLTLILLTTLVSSYVNAQPTPEALLAKLPSIPSSVNCICDRSEIDSFSNKIDIVQEEIKTIIDAIHAQMQNKTSAMANEKAVYEAVSNQSGVSMQELMKVGEMSEADQEKWAQQYANKAMNSARQNPNAAIKKGDQSKRLFELASEEKKIGMNITAQMERISKIFKNVDIQDSIETIKLENKLHPLERQLVSGIATEAEAARSRAAEKQIHAAKVEFGQKMSPIQIDAIAQYLSTVKSLLPQYRRLAEVQNEVVRIQQIGEITPKDLSCYSAIYEYAASLSTAYRYWVGKFNQ